MSLIINSESSFPENLHRLTKRLQIILSVIQVRFIDAFVIPPPPMKIELLIKNLSFLFIEQVIRFKSQSNKIISWIHLNENVKIDLLL